MDHRIVINGVEIPGAEINRLDLSRLSRQQIVIAIQPSDPSKGQAAFATVGPDATKVELYNEANLVASFGPFAKAEVRLENSETYGFEEHIILTEA